LHYSALNNFVRIANQKHAFFAAAFERQLDSLHNVHVSKPLKQSYSLLYIRLNFRCGFFDLRYRQPFGFLYFGQQILLFRRRRFAMSERNDQPRVRAKSLQIIQERLNSSGAQTRGNMRDNARGTKGICCECVGNPGLLRQIVRAIREHARVGIGTCNSDEERVEWLSQNHALSALGGSRIRIGGKNNK
jgi:hypothetical protein